MSVPMISASELRRLVHLEDLIGPVSQALQEFSAGLASAGIISIFPGDTPELGDVLVKAGCIRGRSSYVVKISPWFAENVVLGRPQGGFIAVFDSKTGHTQAILNEEHYLSDLRTAAAGALSARLLAPRNVRTALTIGSGVQAYWQSIALAGERNIENFLIWGRNVEKAEKLRRSLSEELPISRWAVSTDLERAVRLADVIVTTTPARVPVVRGAWLRKGQHITAIGADDPTKCELDAECFERADRILVDSLESNRNHGEVFRHLSTQSIQIGRIQGELGQALAGTISGRTSEEDITIAKLVGLGVQDLAAAEVAVRKLLNTSGDDFGQRM